MSTEQKNIIEVNRQILGGLCIYRNLLSDPIIATFKAFLEASAKQPPVSVESFVDCYSEFFFRISNANSMVDLSQYVFDQILLDENPFTICASRQDEYINSTVKAAALSDICSLRSAVSLLPASIKKCYMDKNAETLHYQAIIKGLPEWIALLDDSSYKEQQPRQTEQSCSTSGSDTGSNTAFGKSTANSLWQLWLKDISCESFLEGLIRYHAINGSGIFTMKYAFTWQHGNPSTPGCLAPVRNPDPVRLSDLIAYESEREEVVKNTEQFLEGYEANNVLLYGDRGTGKSSTVKALLNEYYCRGLRMVEVPKHLLTDFPAIIGQLADKPYKFILFVDDLSFEDSKDSYTALKAVIEGGLEVKPGNILIYATSNRRHLIRENFSDRIGLQSGNQEDEIRSVDTMQEKLSLSDRFGITVVFASPDKKRFLEIVDRLAQKRGIGMEPETLHKEALKWELWYNGRSPRTARQFINYISCRGNRDPE